MFRCPTMGCRRITTRHPAKPPATFPMRIWCNHPLPPDAARSLREGTAGHELTLYSRDGSLPPERDAADPVPAAGADILFGQPDPAALLSADGDGGGTLRWVQLTSAGYTRYDRDDVRAALRARGVALTNSSAVFSEPCAQHLAAMMFSLARQLPRALDNQRGARTWLQHDVQGRDGRILGQEDSVFIYGFGSIARRLAEILAPLRMQLVGVRRSPQGDEGVPMLDHATADSRLGEAGHVVNILPDNPATRGFFGAERFARFQPGTFFYNLGRGATVDQSALAAALREGRLAAAYLDVMTPEPLPPEHPLWDTPNCFLTPHVGGAHVGDDRRLVRHFLDNLARFEAGNQLLDRVM